MLALAFVLQALGGSTLAYGIINLTILLLIDLDPERRFEAMQRGAKVFGRAVMLDAASIGIGFALCALAGTL